MKWGPQPKPRCGRPDCDRDARQFGYCPNHAALLDRNGTPYTHEEVAGMHAANRHEQEMDAALEKNPPVIVWRKDKHGIQRAVSVKDPHAEASTAAQAQRMRRSAEVAEREEAARQAEITRLQVLQLMQDEAAEVAERFRKHRADNTPLLTSARREI